MDQENLNVGSALFNSRLRLRNLLGNNVQEAGKKKPTYQTRRPFASSILDSDDSENEEATNKSEPTKLVQKSLPQVKFGCISIADFPGQVLVRGPALKQPLANMKEFVYYRKMEKGIIGLGIPDFNSLQRSVIPHILRGDDCFILGANKTGKSSSYFLPVVGMLSNSYEENNVKLFSSGRKNAQQCEADGPLCLILCSEFKIAEKVYGVLDLLMSNCSRRQLNYGLICDLHRESRQKLEQGIDIIITTVSFAAEMLKKGHNKFRLDRLRFLVFDDVDVVLRTFPKELAEIQKIANNCLLSHPSRQPYQRIYAGKEWTYELEKLYMELKGSVEGDEDLLPVVHIYSVIQAINYSKMNWTIHHVDENNKVKKLVDLVKSLEIDQHRNVFIVCTSPQEARFVNLSLDKVNIDALLVDMENMNTDDVDSVVNKWDNSPHSRRIMVLHDAILRSLRIFNVTCLIHYGLPIPAPYIKLAAGAERFTCMWGNFRDISEEKTNPQLIYQRQELESHFLLTGQEVELYKFQKFAAKMKCNLPAQLNKIADEIRAFKLRNVPLCQGIKLYGTCMNPVPENCTARHYFLLSELEETPPVPRSCEIEVKITECQNPSLYIGQLLRCYEFKNKRKTLKCSFMQAFKATNTKLDAFFAEKKNIQPLDSFDVGTLCAVRLQDNNEFRRAKIDRVMTRTAGTLFPNTVRVFCLDTGEYLQTTADLIFKLSPELEQLPLLSVEIVLANLKPVDGETDYRPNPTRAARKFTQDKILNGKVHFAVGSTVWVNPLVDTGLDHETNQPIERASIRKDLISQNHAEFNAGHILNIINLCKKTGFKCVEFDELEDNPALDTQFMSAFHRPGDDKRWAFVETSRAENPNSHEVWVAYSKNPYNIFGNLDKFDDQVTDLITDLNFSINEMISDRCGKYYSQFSHFYNVGVVVAVQDRLDKEKQWYRGIIMEKYEEEGELYFAVFLVDIGDHQFNTTTKELFPLPRVFVTRLPFQAICFELSHIEPVETQNSKVWSTEAVDELIDLTLDENRNGRKVEVVAIQSKRHPTLPCRYYSAVMMLPSGVDIGVAIVEKNLAVFKGDGLQLTNLIKNKLLAQYNALYEKNHVDSDDSIGEQEETDPDELDLSKWDTVGIDKFADMMGVNLKGLTDVAKLKSLADNDSSSESDREITVSRVKQQSSGGNVPSGSTASQPSQQSSETPPVPLFSEILYPTVYWKQTTTVFILKVDHPDIKKYSLDVEGKNVCFRTQDPPNYGFDLELHARVEPNPSIVATGVSLTITLKKRTIWKWPKPLQTNVKYRWFKEDLTNRHSSDEEDEEESKPRKMFPSRTRVNYENRSESESSDDDDVDVEETEA